MNKLTTNWIDAELSRGRYRVAQKLGTGGMAEVYVAHDQIYEMDVVVKIPRLPLLQDEVFVERYCVEVELLVHLALPNIIPIADFGEHEEVPFAVLPYLGGGSLKHRRENVTDDLFRWLLPVARMLDAIHSGGYVHRDVKPSNILFDEKGTAYLSDFAIAKALEVSGQKAVLSKTDLVLGTAEYMPPELCAGKAIDGRADQYSLAVVVYEQLSGRCPIGGSTPLLVLDRQLTETPLPLQEVIAWTSPGLAKALDRALAKDPKQRFPCCVEFATHVLEAMEALGQTGKVFELSDTDRQSPVPTEVEADEAVAWVALILLISIVLVVWSFGGF